MGPKGLEPLPAGLKVRCAAVTPRPRNAGRAYAFPVVLCFMVRAPRFSVVALRVELSATRLSAEFGQPALDYRTANVVVDQSGWQDSNLRLVLPKHAGSPLPYIPFVPVRTGGFEPPISWSPTRRDTQASLRSALSSPYGSRTRLSALKGRCPRTDRRTGHLGAYFPRS